jgi:hypothetical protein
MNQMNESMDETFNVCTDLFSAKAAGQQKN